MSSKRDGYWRLAAKRATKETRAALSIETGERAVVAVILAITSIALLWIWGSEGAPWDAAIERVGPFIVLIVAIYPVVWAWKFVRTLPRIDAELRERLADLEDKLRPKIQFTWRPGDNKYFDIFKEDDGNIEGQGKVGRVAVKNISEHESIKGLEVSLINYKTDDPRFFRTVDRHLLNNSTGGYQTTLYPRREANFNLFRVAHRGETLTLGPFLGGGTITLKPDVYYVKITASADAMRREDALFRVSLSQNGTVAFRILSPDGTG